MRVYQPGPEDDLALLKAWDELVTSGELEKTFGRGAMALSSFLKMLAPPEHQTFYEVDDEGIWLLFTLSPAFGAAFVTLWVAKRRRHSHHQLAVVELAYEAAFQGFSLLLGVTKQERLLAQHQRWGYTVVGQVPGLWDGEAAWIVTLTEAAYWLAKQQRHTRRSDGWSTH